MSFLTTNVEYRGSTGSALYNVHHQTSVAMGEAFATEIDKIDNLFQTVPSSLATLDAAKATEIKLALEQLLLLARDGMQDSVGRTFYLSEGMAKSLSYLLDTFNMSGATIDVNANPPTVGLTVESLKLWYNLSHSSSVIGEILNGAKTASFAELVGFVPFIGSDGPIYSTSLQAFVELIYVKQGNEVFSDVLEGLEGALETTKKVLDLLADLQGLKNFVTTAAPDGGGPLNAVNHAWSNYGGGGGVNADLKAWIEANGPEVALSIANIDSGRYDAYGNNRYINQDLVQMPNSAVGFLLVGPSGGPFQHQHTSGLTRAIGEFERIRGALSALLPRLASQTVGSPNILSSAIEDSTLLAKAKKVLEDMNRSISASQETIQIGHIPLPFPPGTLAAARDLGGSDATALWYWLIDDKAPGLNIFAGGPNSVQQNIQVATTAGQNLNDTQKEEVRRFLVLFEEYYKSASAILSKLTQIIEKMAQGIAR